MRFDGTTVTFYRRSDGKLMGYESAGHTNFEQAGSDIVCAAVSALTQSIANGIMDILKAPSTVTIDENNAYLECKLTSRATEDDVTQAQLLFQTLLEGIQSIQINLPKNVRVIFKDWR